MKITKIIIISFLILNISGCFEETINDFNKLTIQYPIYSRKKHINRKAPSIDKEFKNLYEFKEYRDNKNRIIKSEFVQFSFWIDTLVFEDNKPFNPLIDKDIKFEYVRFYIQPAICIGGNYQSLDSNDFKPDLLQKKVLFAEYINPKIVDFYKTPKNIISIADSSAKILDMIIKQTPYFYIIDEYGKIVGQTQDKINFPLIESRYDLVIRYDIKI